MSAPVREQAMLGPLIYAPPWARLQGPAAETDPGRAGWSEGDAAEPQIQDSDALVPVAQQPLTPFEDDPTIMTLQECLALAPDQAADAPDPIGELEQSPWRGIAWPMAARLACTILLALAGALGFRWLSVTPGEPHDGRLAVQQSIQESVQQPLALQQSSPASVAAFKPDLESQSAPLWSLDLKLLAASGTGGDPGRLFTMGGPAPPAAPAATAAAAAVISGPAHRASRATGSQSIGLGARAAMVRAGISDENR
jgi:hypothetical protein